MEKEFRFVILGAGNIARRFSRAVKAIEGCGITAVASKDAEKAKTFASVNGVPRHYAHYAQMLEKEKPDCAYIATTCNSHYALSMLCLEYGIPVLCEKAMFTNTEEAETFFTESEKRGVFSMEALWSLFLPAVLKAREWVASHRIGELVYVDFDLGFIAPKDRENRYYNPELGGGAANDLAIYGFHLLPWITSRKIEDMQVEAVSSFSGVDETELALLKMAGGLPASVKATFRAAVEERMIVYGSRGKIIIPQPHMAKHAMLYGTNGMETECFADSETENGFVYEIRESVRCIRSGLPESPIVPHSATIAAAGLIERIHHHLGI